ncbi:MAG: hypothetical protein JXA21_02810 [Anaerolineae bacterium]|nr:hypothetical protein [Anaerolineae bacterium]
MGKGYKFLLALLSAAAVLFPIIPAIVRADGPVGNKLLIHNEDVVVESQPAVAYNSQTQEYLVVWQAESDGPVREVWGQRLSRGGALLGSAFRISPANGGYNPDVVYNSTSNEYLVVWETGSSILGQRLSSAGAFSGDEMRIAIGYEHGSGSHYSQPAVGYASTANRYLVTYSYIQDIDGSTSIQARSYLNDGVLEDFIDVNEHLSTTVAEASDLAYNRSRNEFLVVWQQRSAPDDHDIHARRVAMSGGAAVLGNPFGISTTGSDETVPAAAAIPTNPDEGRYLVAWQSDRDVMARTLSGVGTLGALLTLANTAWSEYQPAVAACESCQRFLAVWRWIPVSTPPAVMQVQGRTVALDGALLEETITTIGGWPQQVAYTPAVAAGPPGDFLIATDDNATFGSSTRGIYGYLWGNRVYLPVVVRN